MNLIDLGEIIRNIWADKQRGLPILDYARTADRVTGQRIRNLTGHLNKIAVGLDRPGPDAVDAVELTDNNLAAMKAKLFDLGYREKNVDNTASTFKVLRGLAIESGVQIFLPPPAIKPQRNKAYVRVGPRSYVPASRTRVGRHESYGFPYRKWSASLKAEWNDLVVTYYADPSAVSMGLNRRAFLAESA